MSEISSVVGAGKAVLGTGKAVLRVLRRYREKPLRRVVRAAQKRRSLVVLDKTQQPWVLHAGGEIFPAELLDPLKHEGLVEPVTITATQVVGMDYYRLTALGEAFAE